MVHKIYLVRHGEAASNVNNFFAGWVDAPLTELGKMQAQVLRKRLVNERIGRAFCSDSSRARDTLAALSLNCPIEYSKELREKNYGDLEGVYWGDDQAGYERYHLDATARAPGGENSLDVQKRAVAYLKKKVLSANEGEVLIVSHHGPLVLLACHFLDIPLRDWRKLRLGNCGLSIFSKEGKTWRLTLWNSLSHYGMESFKPLLKKEVRR